MSGSATVVFGEPDDRLGATLRRLQEAILLHPVAAQALFFALVEEGRAFARTEEGRRWLARLDGSELMTRSRVLWDALTVRSLEDDPETVLPTAVLEAFVKAATDAGIEHMATTLFLDNPLLGGER